MLTLVISYADSINMAGDFKDNICDKIVISVYNIHNQFTMKSKDSSVSRSVEISYFVVYWNAELCKVTQEGRKKAQSNQGQIEAAACALSQRSGK